MVNIFVTKIQVFWSSLKKFLKLDAPVTSCSLYLLARRYYGWFFKLTGWHNFSEMAAIILMILSLPIAAFGVLFAASVGMFGFLWAFYWVLVKLA